MIVPIYLFSGLANYGTQTLSTFMLPIPTCVCVGDISGTLPVYLFLQRLLLEQYFYCTLRSPSIAVTSVFLIAVVIL